MKEACAQRPQRVIRNAETPKSLMKRIETCFAIIINQAQRVGYGNRKFGIFLITDTISE